MSARATIDRVGVLCLLVATTGWGLNWSIFKLLLQEWPPMFARGTAGLVAAVALGLYAAARGEQVAPPRAVVAPLAWASFTNVFAFMGFSGLALLWLTAGEAALLVYTMPLCATLMAWPATGVRPGPRALAALGLCLLGSFVLFGGGLSTLDGAKWPGVLFAFAAAILFALGTVTSRGSLPMPPIAGTAWQVGLACVAMVGIGVLFEKPDLRGPSPIGWAAWSFMAVVPMGLCFLAWFEAVRRLSAPTAATGSLLVPVVGVLAAAPVLGEPLGLRELLALMLVLSGVALVLVKPAAKPSATTDGPADVSATADTKTGPA